MMLYFVILSVCHTHVLCFNSKTYHISSNRVVNRYPDSIPHPVVQYVLGYPNLNSHFAVVTSDTLLTILAFIKRYSSPLHHVTRYRHRQYRG